MTYATIEDVEDLIPPELLLEAGDDEGDEAAATVRLTRLIDAAEGFINGKLGRRYRVPIDVTVGDAASPAAWLKNMTVFLTASIAYGRRGLSKEFPFATQLDNLMKELDGIASGQQPLYPETTRVNDEVSVIGESSRVWSKQASA
jgi:hypothetical protein